MRESEIEFRPRASADLDGILASIALTLKSPQAARDTADAIFAAIERAAEIPELGQPFFVMMIGSRVSRASASMSFKRVRKSLIGRICGNAACIAITPPVL